MFEASRYAKEAKKLLKDNVERPRYLNVKGGASGVKRNFEPTARFRPGNEANNKKYWEKEENKRCRLCGEESETMGHIFNKFAVSGKSLNWKIILNGEVNNMVSLRQLKWTRKRAEKELQ